MILFGKGTFEQVVKLIDIFGKVRLNTEQVVNFIYIFFKGIFEQVIKLIDLLGKVHLNR